MYPNYTYVQAQSFSTTLQLQQHWLMQTELNYNRDAFLYYKTPTPAHNS